MRYPIYTLIFLWAVSVPPVGAAAKPHPLPAAARPAPQPEPEECQILTLRRDQKLLLEDDSSLRTGPGGVEHVDPRGRVVRTFPRARIMRDSRGRVSVITGKERVEVGVFKAIERFRPPSPPPPAAPPAAPPTTDTTINLRPDQKLVLEGGSYLVRGPDGRVDHMGTNGRVVRSFGRAQMVRDAERAVWVVAGEGRTKIGRFKAIEGLEPSQRADQIGRRAGQPTAASGEGCADPAADRLDVSLLEKTGQFTGRIRVEGVVKNLGSEAWEATSYPQAPSYVRKLRAFLAENYSSRLLPIKEETVSWLPAGGELRFVHEREWDLTTVNPGFVLELRTYSGDCVRTNNRKEVTASQIDWLFGPPSVLTTDEHTLTNTLTLTGHRLLGSGRVEATLDYTLEESGSAKIKASIEPPHTGSEPSASVGWLSRPTVLVVEVKCGLPALANQEVRITYSLYRESSLLGRILGSTDLAEANQTLSYGELCGRMPTAGAVKE